MHWREAVERVWKWLIGTAALLEILTALLLVLLLSFVLPQSPVSPADEAAFSRWTASIRPTWGSWVAPLALLHWLSLRTSLWLRIPLALLALVTSARLAHLAATWRERTAAERGCPLLAGVGALLLLAGWAVGLRWGWTVSEVTAWPGEALYLPERGLTYLPVEGDRRLVCHRYGHYLLRDDPDIGWEAKAYDEAGAIVPLATSTRGATQEKVRLVLNPQNPEAYFAIPSAGLIFRASFRQDRVAGDPPLLIQIYRSASGELITETVLRGDGSLLTETLNLQLKSVLLPQMRVVYNPGAPLTATGWLLLFLSGLIGWRIRARRGDALARPEYEKSVEQEAL
jgi:hypothetical protein